MKKLILTLIISLIFVIPSYARMGVVAIGSGGIAGAGGETPKFCDSKSGYLLCEDFEAVGGDCDAGTAETNCRNTWDPEGACDTEVDYALAVGPLAGTYSGYFAETNNESTCGKNNITAWGNQATQSAYFRMKINLLSGIGANDEEVAVFCHSTLARCCMKVGWDGSQVRFGAAASSQDDVWGATLTPTQGTEYHVWVDYVKATSCKVYVAETSTKPAAVEAETADAPDSYVMNVWFKSADYSTHKVNQIIFDNILIDDAVLGSQ